MSSQVPRGTFPARFSVPADEREHFYRCQACGAWVDMRDIGMVFDHEGEQPHPTEPIPELFTVPTI